MSVLTKPAYLSVPEHDATAGPEAVDLAASVDLHADPEQAFALDMLLAERGGRAAAFESALICGRQNLKTWVLEVAALHDLFLRGVDRVVWTAHRFKTTSDSFADLAAICENYDHLRRHVKAVRYGAGEQSIVLKSGGRIDFLARTGGGGRGLSGDVVVLDEALYLQPMMMGALLPTLSSKPDPVVRYGSSAGMLESSVLRSVRDRGRAGDDPSLTYLEWATEPGGCALERCTHVLGTEGCVLDDEDRWQAANPALGRRITVEYVRNERRALPPAEFARERLGWWEDPLFGGDAAIPQDAWRSCRDERSVPSDPVVLAVDVTPDRSWSAVAVAGGCDAGVHVELIEHASGTEWVVPRLLELSERWRPAAVVLDPRGAAGSLMPALQSSRADVTLTTTGDLVQACGSFYDAVVQGRLRHRGQMPLDSAVAGATRRPVGDAWAWNRRSTDVDICPLVAVTLASWGLEQQGAAVAEPSVYLI